MASTTKLTSSANESMKNKNENEFREKKKKSVRDKSRLTVNAKLRQMNNVILKNKSFLNLIKSANGDFSRIEKLNAKS